MKSKFKLLLHGREEFRLMCNQLFEAYTARIPSLLITCEEQWIFASSPQHLRRYRNNQCYWSYYHEHLRDDSSTISFRAHYRMNKVTFESLVEALEEHPALQLQAHSATLTYIQVAIDLWRYANSHFGFRMAQTTMGINQGSYHNFSERFMQAMIFGRQMSKISLKSGRISNFWMVNLVQENSQMSLVL